MRMQFPIGVFILSCCLSCCLGVDSFAQSAQTAPQISLAIRTSSQMERADADVVAVHQSAIARAAAFYDFTLDSSWSYEQAVCPLAPQDIILNYYLRQPHGVSSFSAVVPRQGSVIRIVPLVHDGTAPSVAPWGEHSYHVFNAMTAGPAGPQPRNISSGQANVAAGLSPGDKFEWGLCYVALVNERAVVSHPDNELHVFSATEPTFRLGNQGGSELSFTVRDDSRYYSVWQLEFSPKGALIRADRDQHMLPTQDLETATSIVPESTPSERVLVVSPGTPSPTTPGSRSSNAPAPASVAAGAVRTSVGSVQAAETTDRATNASSGEDSFPTTQSAVSIAPVETRPARKTKPSKSDWHVVPVEGPPVEHSIPDSQPLVTHPVPQS